MKFKKLVKTIHLWIGLASGLVVFVVAVTGAIYVFSDEIIYQLRQDAIHVEPRAEETLPLSTLWKQIQIDSGTSDELWRIDVFNRPDKSWVFNGRKNSPEAITYLGLVDYWESFYVDPYSGELLQIYDEEKDFFNVVKLIHYSLLLNFRYGKPIVGISTIIVVLMLMSGIYMWWPRNKKLRGQKFLFQWKIGTSWKRKNLDLHNILGFYVSSVVVIIALTGLVYVYPSFRSLVYMVGAGTTVPQDIPRVESVLRDSKLEFPLDHALNQTRQLHPTAELFTFSPPANSRGTISVRVQQKVGARYVAHDLQFDQYSGELLRERNHADLNSGEKLLAANYDIHVGAILGIPGKILAFVASLLCASLPITGFMVWWGKRRINSSKVRKPAADQASKICPI
jgi:uncharacterized iron-regulated membrane protein